MILISDIDINGIIEDAITRERGVTLDRRDKGMAGLSFMEAGTSSFYRLRATFEASKTSYRLLVFLKFMQETVRRSRIVADPDTGELKKITLAQPRDSLFECHGASLDNDAVEPSTTIKNIHRVKTFPELLKAMHGRGSKHIAADFTTLLRGTVKVNMDQGYSKWALTPRQALKLRLQE